VVGRMTSTPDALGLATVLMSSALLFVLFLALIGFPVPASLVSCGALAVSVLAAAYVVALILDSAKRDNSRN